MSNSSPNFEKGLEDAATTVAEFDQHDKGFVAQFHHALNRTPALVPLIVLVAAIAVFGLLLGSKFFPPLRLR